MWGGIWETEAEAAEPGEAAAAADDDDDDDEEEEEEEEEEEDEDLRRLLDMMLVCRSGCVYCAQRAGTSRLRAAAAAAGKRAGAGGGSCPGDAKLAGGAPRRHGGVEKTRESISNE